MNGSNNIRPNLVGDLPQVHPTALIDPSAQIIGNVIIGKDVFIGPLTVIRSDERGPDGKVAPIVIGEEVNIQDGVIIHSHGETAIIRYGPCFRRGPSTLRALRSQRTDRKKRKSLWMMFLDQFKDFMILVLIAAAVVAGVIGEPSDTIAIAVIVLLNAVLGFVQEYRAEKAMAALKKLAAPSATVIRDGRPESITAERLVPGRPGDPGGRQRGAGRYPAD
jgi:NDP-sugar pyrophosphorylase family protein